MTEPADKKEKKVVLKLPQVELPEDLDTVYSNMVRIAHTPTEMVFDYARLLPGDKRAKVVSRVVMSPLGTKLLLKALGDNLAKYESAFGEIKIPQKHSLAEFLFKPPQPDKDTEE